MKSAARTTLAALLAVFAVAAALGETSAPEPASATIPFETAGRSTILVPIRINGSAPFRFVLDSGASLTVIDQARAKDLHLDFGDAVEGHGAGKGTFAYRVVATPVRLSVGVAEFGCEKLAALDLTNQLAILGRPIDGILGYDVFQRYAVEIDYEARVVRLFEPGSLAAAQAGVALPLTITKRLPYVTADLKVKGQPLAKKTLLVDTGSEDAVDDDVVLSSKGPKREVTGGVGLGQEYKVTFGRIASARLGPYELKNVPSVAPGVPLIGSSVLRHFRLTFDYRHGKFYLAREPVNTLDFSDSSPGSGLDLREGKSGLDVHDVIAKSPAEAAGLHAGDAILTIDGTPAADFGVVRAQQLLDRPGTAYLLVVTLSGSRREVTLRIPAA